MAKGLDIGTCFLVCASSDPKGVSDGSITSIRDAFVSIESDRPGVKNMLKLRKIPMLEDGDMIHIVGDKALEIANMFGMELRRPMSSGVISPKERSAEPILVELVKSVLGEPSVTDEVCYYSVPAAPIDLAGVKVEFHEAMFRKIIESFGYRAMPLNEAVALVYSNCMSEGFSGLAISFGAGMVNVALVYNSMPGSAFSIARSGDWIDSMSGDAVGRTAAHMMTIKERGINLLDYNDGDPASSREREALCVYYRNLVVNTVQDIKKYFRNASTFTINEKIPLIISGGTTGPKNFLEFFKSEFEKIKDFPIPISEIRMANDPRNDVANGLLVVAQSED